jgi:hypothetical protein
VIRTVGFEPTTIGSQSRDSTRPSYVLMWQWGLTPLSPAASPVMPEAEANGHIFESGWQDLNLRPLRSRRSTLTRLSYTL